MNRVTIHLEALRQNLETVNGWMRERGSTWTLVTKVLCGHRETLRALQMCGVQSMGDSRLENLRTLETIAPELQTWYLRIPDLSSIESVVRLSSVSLNSEISVIHALDEEARRHDKIHGIIIMIELGDLREGILPGSLIKFYRQIFELPNIRVHGIGSNLGCLAGAVPTIDQFMQLVLYRELLELKFDHRLELISAGSSVSLPMVLEKHLPRAINHFRIGEAVFLGSNLIGGGTLPGLRDDVVMLEAEIAEIKEKGLVPLGETAAITPFQSEAEEDTTPGQRGYRALIGIGQLDTDIYGLTPVNPHYQIAGASSDITVINLGEDADGLKVGDTILFRPNYSALLRLMSGRYLEKAVTPSLEDFSQLLSDQPLAFEPVFQTAV